MAARAMYLLPAGDISQPICFYIHYDGYLEGAVILGIFTKCTMIKIPVTGFWKIF